MTVADGKIQSQGATNTDGIEARSDPLGQMPRLKLEVFVFLPLLDRLQTPVCPSNASHSISASTAILHLTTRSPLHSRTVGPASSSSLVQRDHSTRSCWCPANDTIPLACLAHQIHNGRARRSKLGRRGQKEGPDQSQTPLLAAGRSAHDGSGTSASSCVA